MDQETPEGTPASPETPAESPPAMPAETVPAPAATAPPPVAWNASVPAAAPGRRVTGLAKIAAGILIVVGVILVLGGLLALGSGGLIDAAGQGTEPGPFGYGTSVAAVVIILLVVGFIGVLAGIGAWRGNMAGRIVGIIMGVLLALIGVGGFSASSASGSLGFSVIFVLAFAYVAVVLLFRWKTRAPA